jgi:glycosyltransferase involved in cell wall biosynthesis
MNISAVIIVKNGAKTIKKTLDSLYAFDDVVVYDNGSTDNTAQIVLGYTNVSFHKGEFLGFGATKNLAASFAKHDWILIVDSDEVVDAPLLATLQTKRLSCDTIYILNFKAFYKGIQVKHCGWNDQKIQRLYNKSITRFNANHVHENIIDTGMKKELLSPGNMEHYSYMSISEFIIKADRYSTLYANDNFLKKSSSPAKAFLNGGYSFFRTYILKRGFLDGYVGLVIAFSHMVTNFYKYIKLYEKNREENEKSA